MESLKASSELNKAYNVVPDVVSLERIQISEDIFTLLAPVMNEVHGKNYSFRFWKIVMNNYVNAAVSIMHLLKEQEINGGIPLLPINSHHIPTFKQKIIARLPALIKHYKTYGNLSKMNRVLAEHNDVSIGLPDLDIVRKDTGYSIPLYYPVYPGKGNSKKRALVNKIAARYSNLFHRNIIKRLPQVYVEYFDKDYNSIRLVEPASKTIHTHGLPVYYNSLLIAKYIEHGAKLYCYQHGANYGEMIGHNSHFYESSVADEFRSWGWKIRSNDVPWKAYRMEKFKLMYDGFAKTGSYDVLMCYPDMHLLNIDFCKSATDYFLTNINADEYKKILARPRPLNKLFSHAKNLSFIQDSRVTIDSGLTNMAEVVSKCKLVIQFTVPGTNFMECIYVNHPTMGLLENDQPTDAVKPYYDFLLQQGVLHNSYVSLVDHLAKINVDEWWASVIKEPMYLQFKNEFLRKV
jgi:hypothetical protein